MICARHERHRARGAWLSRRLEAYCRWPDRKEPDLGFFPQFEALLGWPDISQSEWGFLPGQFSFVLGLTAAGSNDVHDKSSTWGRTRMANQSNGR